MSAIDSTIQAIAPAATNRVAPSAPARLTPLFVRAVSRAVANRNAAHQPAWVSRDVLGQNADASNGAHRKIHHAITATTGKVTKKTFDRRRRRRRSTIHAVAAIETTTQRTLSRKRGGDGAAHSTPAASRGDRNTAVGSAISPR